MSDAPSSCTHCFYRVYLRRERDHYEPEYEHPKLDFCSLPAHADGGFRLSCAWFFHKSLRSFSTKRSHPKWHPAVKEPQTT
jgi:hypothetical protein